MKQLISLKQFGLATGTAIITLGLAAAPTGALSSQNGAATAASTSSTTAGSSSTQTNLKPLIKHSDTEISRRLKNLNGLKVKVSSSTKLSTANKTALTNEIDTEIAGLTALKTKIDADTDATTAKADATTIFTEYRVYALVLPKVHLVKTADDQQVAEGKLNDLAAKLQTRITTAQTAGKDVTSLQASLNDMKTKTAAAQGISSSVESAVINLQPADYNSNHAVLSGERDKLKTAQADIKAATADAKTIVSGLANL